MRLFLVGISMLSAFLLAAEDSARVTYYLVEGTMTAGGKPAGGSVSLVHRTIDQAKGTIEERVLSLRGTQAAREFVMILKPKGNKVALTAEDGSNIGEGELTGEVWHWTDLKFTSNAGQTLEGQDHFTSDGMSAEKRVLGADGRPQVVIKETGRTISEATYRLLRARLLPAP